MFTQEQIGIYLVDYMADQDCDLQSAMRDLLTELRHYSEFNSLDFQKAIEGSLEVYAVENWSLEDKVNLLVQPDDVSDTAYNWILYDIQNLGDDVSLSEICAHRVCSLESP